MKTLKIIVNGSIQKVGYRIKVVDIANKLDIKGEIENLENNSVKIIAQGEENKVNEFIEQINIKNTLIKVNDVSFKYIDSDTKYADFKKIVKTKETDERLDTAAEHLKKLIEVTKEGVGYSKQMLGKQDQMLEKQDKNTDVLSGKLDNIHNDLSINLNSFHQDTITRFDVVDEKYGKISDNMGKIFNEMKEERIESRKSMEKLIGAIVNLIEKK